MFEGSKSLLAEVNEKKAQIYKDFQSVFQDYFYVLF